MHGPEYLEKREAPVHIMISQRDKVSKIFCDYDKSIGKGRKVPSDNSLLKLDAINFLDQEYVAKKAMLALLGFIQCTFWSKSIIV